MKLTTVAKTVAKFAAPLLLCAYPGIVAAQDAFSTMGEMAVQHGFNTINNVVLPGIVRDNLFGTQGNRTSRKPSKPTSTTTSTTYLPSAEAQAQAKASLITLVRRNNPQAATQLAQALRGQDIGRIWESMVSTDPGGRTLKRGDVADALTAYMLLSWMISQDNRGDLSPAAVRAVRQKIAQSLSTNPQMKSEATRAKVGEELLLRFVFVNGGWQGSIQKGNVRQYSDGVMRSFQSEFGVNLRDLALTDAGFRPRK